jgi:hypothetical protein
VTVVALASVKGAPGVTTTACLVGGTWPEGRAVFVAECDPAGGDLAARFALPSLVGWPTLETAARRAGTAVPVGPHLQQLPGGLGVLTRTRPGWGPVSDTPMCDLVLEATRLADRDGDVVVDVGRLLPGATDAEAWCDRSDLVVVVLRADAPSVVQVRERSGGLRAQWGDRVTLVVIGAGPGRAQEIEQFVGIPVAATLPSDPVTAAMVTGLPGRPRRLRRAPLVPAASRLARWLAGAPVPVAQRGPGGGRETGSVGSAASEAGATAVGSPR